MEIKKSSTQPSTRANPDWFTGAVRMYLLVKTSTLAKAAPRIASAQSPFGTHRSFKRRKSI